MHNTTKNKKKNKKIKPKQKGLGVFIKTINQKCVFKRG
jgi:hypothetical protein